MSESMMPISVDALHHRTLLFELSKPHQEKRRFASHALDGIGRKGRIAEESTIQTERTEAIVKDATKRKQSLRMSLKVWVSISDARRWMVDAVNSSPSISHVVNSSTPPLTRHELLYPVRPLTLILLPQAALHLCKSTEFCILR